MLHNCGAKFIVILNVYIWRIELHIIVFINKLKWLMCHHMTLNMVSYDIYGI